MKRFLSVLLVLTILTVPAVALADYDYDSIPTPNILVVDGDDPSVVFFERNADQRVFPASTTKIMTTLVVLESGKLDDLVTVGAEIKGTIVPITEYSSRMGLIEGETLSLRDLLYGLMLLSGNDAAEAIAKYVAGSVDAFADLMNQKAQEIGMSNTHFTNPHGIQNDNHYTTARDMAKLMAYALKNDDFIKIAGAKTYTVPANNVRTTDLVLVNTDRLLNAVAGDPVQTVYQYALAGKTGDTDAAGKCFVVSAEKDGARVIIAMFGDKADLYGGDTVTTNLARFVNAAGIFEYVFANGYQTVTAAELGLQKTFTTGVVNANADDLTDGQLTMSAQIDSLTIRAASAKIDDIKANAGAITANVVLTTDAQAPISAGQSMGTVDYMLGESRIASADLIADFAVGLGSAESAAQPDETAVVTAQPDGTPLIDKGRKDWGASDTLRLTFILLGVLLAALVVVFILSEQKRRYERKRRARAKQRRQQYYE